HFNSTRTTLARATEDLTTTNNGSILLQSLNGDIVVRPGTDGEPGISANGTGNILLQTLNSGTILTQADVRSGSGHITLSSFDDLVVNERLQTSSPGTIYLNSLGTVSVQSLTTNNTNLGVSAGEDIVLGTIQAGNGNVALSAVGNIVDNETINTGRNVSAHGLIMKATGMIGGSDTTSPSDINRHAISTAITSLTAQSASGIYVQELDGLAVTSVVVPVTEVQFRGTTLGRTSTQEDLTTTINGPIKVQSTDGDIVVNGGTPGSNGVTANGTGDILLQTLNSGTVVLNSTVATGSGNITLAANGSMVIGDYLRTAAPGSIVLRSGGSVSIGDGGLSTNNANLALFAAGDISLGAINSGTGNVYLDATGRIARITPGKDEINITASTATLLAGVKIGDADQTNIVNDYNFNAITTNVATLAARSATGIYIFEQSGVTVDRIITSIAEVHFNSTTANTMIAVEDLTTTNNGSVLLQSLQGDILVRSGSAGEPGISADGNGNILLQTLQAGTIRTEGNIVSETGHISLNSHDDLTINERLATNGSGTIYLSSQGSVSIDSLHTTNTNLGVHAQRAILLGVIDAGSSNVSLDALGSILDNPSLNAGRNVTASGLTMIAKQFIGGTDLSGSIDANRNAITTSVEILSARSGAGIYLQELDGLTITSVTTPLSQVRFNGNVVDRTTTDEDLTTTNNGTILVQSLDEDIVVEAGFSGEPGIRANGSGNILLQTVHSGTVRTQADIVSDFGHITLSTHDDLVINEKLRTSSPGSIFLKSDESVFVESLETRDTNLGVVAGNDIQLGTIRAGQANVTLTAQRDILDIRAIDSGRNIAANGLSMVAGNSIGASDLSGMPSGNRNAITTAVNTLAAHSATGVYVQELDGLTVTSVSTSPAAILSMAQVHFNGQLSDRSTTVEDLTTSSNGPIKLQSLTGDVVIGPGTSGTNGVTADGSGDILLETLDRGAVKLQAVVQAGSGHITVSSFNDIVVNDTLKTGGGGTVWIESQGDVSLATYRNFGSNLGVRAQGDILLGTVDVGGSQVYLNAANDIALARPIGSEPTIRSVAASLKAGGLIGASGVGGIGQYNPFALETQLDSLAAESRDGIFIRERDQITIDRIETELFRVHFNSSRSGFVESQEDLVTTVEGSIQLHAIAGDIHVLPGSVDAKGILANGRGDIDLRTIDQGSIFARATIESGSGRISLDALASVWIDKTVSTGGDIQLRGVEGSIDELSGDAKVIGDELTIISGAHTHLHDTTVRTLSGATGTNARLENWQQVNRLASEQGDDFLDALRTVDDAQRESLRSHYRFADRYETDGYSLYLVNSKALTVGTLVAGVSSSSPSGLDQPTIYVEASQGDLVVQHKLESMSRTSQAGGIVLVASGELGIGSQGVIQTRSIEDGQTHVQVINNIDLRARVFDALEKPNPTGGLFTTRIVSQNNLGESALPEVPVQAGPTKRQLQGVATHFGSVDEAGFNLFVGYADGKLEQFSDEGDVYQRDALDRMPVEARPQAVGAVGYLERSTPFTVDFLNSVQELPTDVIVRRSDDFFLFQGEVPGGLNTFNPPNPPAGTSTGFYDLTVQSHRVPDVISEGSDNGLPMPPPPEVDVPQSKQPEPYVVQDVQTTPVQSAEYEDEPLQDRKVRIVVARIRVAIEEQELENEDPEARNKRINKQYIEIELPDDILANDNQVSQSQINRIEDYLKKQPGTRAGRYVILEETSDGEKREIAYIVIGTEDNQPRSQKPQEEPSGSEPSESGAPNAPGQAPGSEDQARYETRPDSSLEKSGRDDVGTVNQDKAWGILLGAYWLSKNSERKDHQEREKPFAQANSVSESDFSSRARRMRRLNSAGQNCNEEQS
ncbi:MAG: hypothetical protein RL240_361, partial [Planctomycetota bacterium]